MKVMVVKAKYGREFVMTEFGLEHAKVRERMSKPGGKMVVPKAWIDNGYVMEVKYGQEQS